MTEPSEAEATVELVRRTLSAQALLLLHLLRASDLPETMEEGDRQGLLAVVQRILEPLPGANEELRLTACMFALRAEDILQRAEPARQALRNLRPGDPA